MKINEANRNNWQIIVLLKNISGATEVFDKDLSVLTLKVNVKFKQLKTTRESLKNPI
ncbi:MAG: hypothetical protein NXI20_21075 [bacterium]|nr:hypothetical protein [bacterium]